MQLFLTGKLPMIQTELEENRAENFSEAGQNLVGSTAWIFISLGLIIAVLIIVIVILLICLAKKGKTETGSAPREILKKSFLKNHGLEEKKKSKEEKIHCAMPVPDRNIAIYPEIVLVNLNNNEYIYRARIVDQIMIGRGEGADIRITKDPAVSSRHCIISVKGTQFYLEDCNSSNGTRYNDQEVTMKIPVMSGGILEIGRNAYRMMIGNC